MDSEGRVTGIKGGHVTITVRTADGGYEAESEMWVRGVNPGIDVEEGLDAEYLNLEMIPGETRRLIINRNGVYVYGVRYKIISGKCITLKNGVVTAKKLKKNETSDVAKVEAAYWDKTVTFTIKVNGTVPAVEAGEKGRKISAPKTLKLTVGTDKDVTVNLPKALEGMTVTPDKTDYGVFSLGAAKPDAKGKKVSFTITPKTAGAAYIIWTVNDGGKKSQALTKVIVKKPVDSISVYDMKGFDKIEVGEGGRLLIMLPKENTDTKDLSFKVKGKNVKCSKSGFVTVTDPSGEEATITIKSGKITRDIQVKAAPFTPDKHIKLNKTSVIVKAPKVAGKTAAVKLKFSILPKISETPAGIWGLPDGTPAGIKTVDGKPGSFTIDSTVPPGSYIVTAKVVVYNTAYCELIVK